MSELRVFYDGACRICYKEVNHYKKKDQGDYLILEDISTPEFEASKYGLKSEDVNLHMHAIDKDGKVFIGVDTFIEIWRRLPNYDKLIPIFENKKLRPVIDKGYNIFAKFVRPHLPKRKCQEGHCELPK